MHDTYTFICTNCKEYLGIDTLYCEKCGMFFEEKNGIFVHRDVGYEKDKEFYDAIYNDELGKKWFQGLNRKSFLKKVLERISLSYRRERFFKKYLKGKNNNILDLACGVGRDYLKNYGHVVGVDLSFEALMQAKDKYDICVQSGVQKLPFPDNTFDYVVSSDFFGHVRHEDKDVILQEIYRVLKQNGLTIHIIETDSTNRWFRTAHTYPKLFQKYFVEEIGGHVGLELPVMCLARWKNNGFDIVHKKKIWGTIWPIQDYKRMFDNEYRIEEVSLNKIVTFSKLLSQNKFIQVITNIFLNPLNSIVEKCTDINNGQGIMIVCKKK